MRGALFALHALFNDIPLGRDDLHIQLPLFPAFPDARLAVKELMDSLQNGVRFFIDQEEDGHHEDGDERPDEQPPPGIEGDEGDGEARREDGKHARDADDDGKKGKAHARKPRHKAQHVVGEDGQQKHGGKEYFILALDLFEPLIERLFAHQPSDHAVTRKAPHGKGCKGAQKDADEAIHAAEQGPEERAPRHHGDGAGNGQDDDLQELQHDEDDAHPHARALDEGAEKLLVRHDLPKPRAQDDKKDDGGDEEQN